MRTIEQQLKEATRAYILSLNEPKDGMARHRYAVYLQKGDGELEILWPSDSQDGEKSKEREVVDMAYSKRTNYPAFHFALGGCGYDKTHEIGQRLRRINPNIEVSRISGWSPSRVSL